MADYDTVFQWFPRYMQAMWDGIDFEPGLSEYQYKYLVQGLAPFRIQDEVGAVITCREGNGITPKAREVLESFELAAKDRQGGADPAEYPHEFANESAKRALKNLTAGLNSAEQIYQRLESLNLRKPTLQTKIEMAQVGTLMAIGELHQFFFKHGNVEDYKKQIQKKNEPDVPGTVWEYPVLPMMARRTHSEIFNP